MDYIKNEDGYKITKNLKKKRLKVHYNDLFPLVIPFEDEKGLLGFIKEELKEVDFNNNLIFFCNYDILKPVMLYGFLSLGKYVEYDFLSMYKLLDIYFDKDDDYINFSQIKKDYMILYGNYGEIRNEMLPEIINRIVEQRFVDGKYTWIFYKGNEQNFIYKYKDVDDILKERGYKYINIKIPPKIKKTRKSRKKNRHSINKDMEEI